MVIFDTPSCVLYWSLAWRRSIVKRPFKMWCVTSRKQGIQVPLWADEIIDKSHSSVFSLLQYWRLEGETLSLKYSFYRLFSSLFSHFDHVSLNTQWNNAVNSEAVMWQMCRWCCTVGANHGLSKGMWFFCRSLNEHTQNTQTLRVAGPAAKPQSHVSHVKL